MDIKKELIILNFLILFFFSTSIVSISAFTFFQVLIIFYAFFLFIKDLLKKYKEKYSGQKRILKESCRKLNVKTRLNLFNLGYFLIFFGFIISFILSSSIKFSIIRLPIYAITILIIPSSYFLFSRFNKEINDVSNKYLFFNIILTFIIVIINFILILKSYSSIKLILKERQVGFLRNPIGFAYCMIFPVFYLVYNEYIIIKKGKRKLILFSLPIIFLAILIQLVLVISSGSRTALFSVILSSFFSIFLYFIKTKKNIFVYIVSSFLIILILLFIFYIFLPLLKSESISNLYNRINNYLIKNRFLTLRRINTSLKVLVKMVYLLNNPSEIPKSNTSENFRVAAIIASFKIIEKRPINGTGPFAWNSYIKQNKPIFDVFPPESLKHTHCHNDFLQILAEFGIFFFIGFIFLIFSSIKSIFIKIKNEYSFNYIIILTIFLILLLGGLTDFLFGHPIVGSYYGFFLGIFTSLNKKQEFNS